MAKLRHIAMVVEDMEGESKKDEANGAVRCGGIMLAAAEGGGKPSASSATRTGRCSTSPAMNTRAISGA